MGTSEAFPGARVLQVPVLAWESWLRPRLSWAWLLSGLMPRGRLLLAAAVALTSLRACWMDFFFSVL